MNGYFRQQFNGSDVRQTGQANGAADNILLMDSQQGAMGHAAMPGSQSLDEIVSRNSKEMRRGSVSIPFNNDEPSLEPNLRRMAMMEFNATSPMSPLEVFSFEGNPNVGVAGMMRPSTNLSRHNSDSQLGRQTLPGHISLNTQLQNHNSQPFSAIAPPSSAFTSPLANNHGIDLDMTSPYLGSTLPVSMDLSDQSMNAMINTDPSTVNFFPQPQYASPVVAPSLRQNFARPSKTAGMNMINPNVTQKESFEGDEAQNAMSTTPEAPSQNQDHLVRTSQTLHTANQTPSSQDTNMSLGQDSQVQSQKVMQPQLPNNINDVKFHWTTPPGE